MRGDGMEGILGVFEARERRGQPMAFVAFDLLQLDSRDVMGEPGADRCKRLEDPATVLALPNVTIVPVTDDAARLWTTAWAWAVRASCSRIGGRPNPHQFGIWPVWPSAVGAQMSHPEPRRCDLTLYRSSRPA